MLLLLSLRPEFDLEYPHNRRRDSAPKFLLTSINIPRHIHALAHVYTHRDKYTHTHTTHMYTHTYK